MNTLPSLASSNIADLLSKPLPSTTHHRYAQLFIGDNPTPTTSTLVTTATAVASPEVVDTAVPTSGSVPTVIDPNSALAPLPIVLDTGASFSLIPSHSDFLSEAPNGLVSVSTSVALVSKAPTFDPHALITGEGTVTDLSSPDSIDSDSVAFASTLGTLGTLEFCTFGTTTLIFISGPNSELIQIVVEPTQIDWIHWVPLPRLTPTESYFQLLGLDYIQVFAFLHFYPLWIALLYLSVSALFALIRSE